ncbi:hypothetical protein CEXT_490871 [Caerostris extrusa]|uniref:Uncharacterized protein n=1 Tax=Caerostris extrusa TaxID=172846 RepID=A0AAV4XKN3_CAEEX|nr:hypothetical protein CEXT_490871 [Caerostris extrusa]
MQLRFRKLFSSAPVAAACGRREYMSLGKIRRCSKFFCFDRLRVSEESLFVILEEPFLGKKKKVVYGEMFTLGGISRYIAHDLVLMNLFLARKAIYEQCSE